MSPRATTLLLLACTACARPDGGGAGPTRVGFIAPPGDSSGALRGARLGAAEAVHAGDLVGREFHLITERAANRGEVEAAARRLLEAGVVALVGGYDEESCRALAAAAERAEVLYFDAGCRADALRRHPARTTFHVEASDSMYAAAPAADVISPADTLRVLWHSDLTRYGASQLNDRFRRQTGAAADGPAWAAWMALKVLWEALLRTRTTDADALAAFLVSDSARFDGHKGEPLAFDPVTHQLRQPIYRVDPAALAAGSAEEGDAGDTVRPGTVPLTGEAYAFVTNEGSRDVSVIDLSSQRVVSRIPMGARPRGVQASPGGGHILVALSDDAPTSASDDDAIVAISLPEGRVTVRHPAGTDPEQFAISPDGRLLYAANEDAGTASITSLETEEVLATLVVGIEPEGVAVSPDGRWVYVTAETSNTVSVIDTRSREVAASFLVDVRPRGVAFSPTRPRAYVTNEISGTLSVIDTGRHEVIGSIPLHGGEAKPVGVVASPDGSRVYVANGHANSVSIVDAAQNRVITEIPVGTRPWGIAVSPDGAHLYTANGGSNDVSVIDTRTLRVTNTIPVGDRPWGIAILQTAN